MNLKTYLQDMTVDQKRSFAQKADTSVAYLSQLANGHRRAGIRACRSIEMATCGVVKMADLRPDLFGEAGGAEEHAA